MGDLSEHFSRLEFCYPKQFIDDVYVDARLLEGLEALRAQVGGQAVEITSPGGGNRPADVKSLHSLGRAADVHVQGLALWELHEAALHVAEFGLSGLGLYPTELFVHVDVGRDAPMRWVRINGVYYYY